MLLTGRTFVEVASRLLLGAALRLLVAEAGEVVFLCELFDLVSTHHVAEVEDAVADKLNQVKVKDEDFSALMQLACGEGPRQKLLRQILARFLGLRCTSFHQVSKEINWFPF